VGLWGRRGLLLVIEGGGKLVISYRMFWSLIVYDVLDEVSLSGMVSHLSSILWERKLG
jgi:hypothetical protein